MIEERDLKIIEQHLCQLGEHFDSVQIFATRHDPEAGGTVNAQMGSGNWFTRYGQVREWIIKEDARARAEALAQGEDEEEA